MKNTTRTVLAALILLGLFFLLGVGGGLWLADAMTDTGSIAYKARVKLAGVYWRIKGRDVVRERTIPTNRVTLHERMLFLPEEMAEFAGGMAALDGRSLLVLDREGRLYHVDGDAVRRLEVTAPDNGVAALRGQLEAGRFGAMTVNFAWVRFNDVLHVRDGTRAWLLASYTQWHPEELCATSTLARVEVPAQERPEQWRIADRDWQVVMRTNPCLKPFTPADATEIIHGLEAGGRLALAGGTRVIWTTGSYERDDRYRDTDFSRALAQDESSDHGRVIEVDFLSGKSRHLARGLRNPQGLAVDSAGRIWVADHGMRGGDELNLVSEGANFGFPAVTYGTHYDGSPAGNRGQHANHDGYDKPVLAFVPSIGTGALVALEGVNYAWEGDLLVSGMGNQTLYRVHVEDGRAVYAEPISIGYRVRDMLVLDDGTLALMTDHRRMLFLRAEAAEGALPALQRKVEAAVPEDARPAVLGTLQACLQCHSLADGENRIGPSLQGICDRAVADTDFPAYSDALRSLGGRWTRERLTELVADPGKLIPGTTMVWPGITDRVLAGHVAQVLCH